MPLPPLLPNPVRGIQGRFPDSTLPVSTLAKPPLAHPTLGVEDGRRQKPAGHAQNQFERQQVGAIRPHGGGRRRRLSGEVEEAEGGAEGKTEGRCKGGRSPAVSVIWTANGKIDGLRQGNKTRGGDKM